VFYSDVCLLLNKGLVLYPKLIFAAAYWLPDSTVPKDFNDSKQLTPEKRAALFKQIRASDSIGFTLRILHASEISRNMLRRVPYNLNAMSHDAAMEMIWAVLGAGVKIDTCYIDTVGHPDAYKAKLDRVFQAHNIQFVVEKKADAKYATCSAASVVAKESRDALTANWKWSETNGYEPKEKNFGSGYPSDQTCANWMKANCNIDPPFGYPDFVRFSWGPAKNALKGEGGTNNPIIRWEADEEEEDESGGKQSSLDVFVVAKNGDKRKRDSSVIDKKKRFAVFNELGLSKVVTFGETS
jgi:ribonuclease H2 subunit A